MRSAVSPIVALAMLLLAACASEPVFVEDIREFPAVDGRLLVVPPVAGTDSQTGRKLAENMAWGLREAGYPAIFADQADSLNPVLQGTIDETEFGQEIVWISLRWTLLEPPATTDAVLRPIAGTYRHQVATTIEEWAVLSRRTVSMIVAEAVPALNEFASPLIFPDGPPVRVVTPATENDQYAAIDGDTVFVSGTTDAQSPSAEKKLQFAQFEPVFEPAAVDSLPASPPPAPSEPAVEETTVISDPPGQVTDSSTERLPSVSDILQPAPSKPVEPDPVAENHEAMPAVKPTSVERNVSKSSVAETSNPDDSPFSGIDETVLNLSEGYALTPESAALVTTDPWLTIDEPVIADDAVSVEETSQETSIRVALEPPPPPPTPVDETLSGPISETVVAQTPADAPLPASPQPNEEVAENGISASTLNATAPPNEGRPIFIIRPVQGAPGDGNMSLTQAIAEALRQMDAAVTNDPLQATHIVQGIVRVDSPFAGRQKVKIVWRVTAMDGEVTGQAVQENQVPQGSLDGTWGATAGAVAHAAVKGIEQLFTEPVSATQSDGLSQPDLPHVGND